MSYRHTLNTVIVVTTGVLLLGSMGCCCLHCAKPEVDLEPDDPRPVLSIQVADPQEAALLQQKLGFEAIRLDGTTLELYPAEGLEEKLRALGYRPVEANLYQVYSRIVRIDRQGNEKELLAMGVSLINREKDYWVVEGTLSTLRALERGGYRLRAVREPRPREVIILAHSTEDVQRIIGLHVDIYSVLRKEREMTVFAGAFDSQIDRLRELGFTVNLAENGGVQ